jgi:hypothetical protein
MNPVYYINRLFKSIYEFNNIKLHNDVENNINKNYIHLICNCCGDNIINLQKNYCDKCINELKNMKNII